MNELRHRGLIGRFYIGDIIIGIFLVGLIIILCILILSHMGKTYSEKCCQDNDLEYVFYECQCNIFAPCDNLTCGSFCKTSDGRLIDTSNLTCKINDVIEIVNQQ